MARTAAGQTTPGCFGGPGEGPDFAYTVGLFGFGHPELLIFGAGMRTAGGVLNAVSDRARAGENLVPGQLVTFPERPHRIVVETVPNPGEIVFEANRFYQCPDEASVQAPGDRLCTRSRLWMTPSDRPTSRTVKG